MYWSKAYLIIMVIINKNKKLVIVNKYLLCSSLILYFSLTLIAVISCVKNVLNNNAMAAPFAPHKGINK
jgi:hypothetical protein